MGLDNGFYLGGKMEDLEKCKAFFSSLADTIPPYSDLDFLKETEHFYSPDIFYMRKWWGVRDKICAILDMQDNSTVSVSIEQLEEIIAYLKSLNKQKWNNRIDSVWDWKDIKGNRNKGIRALKQTIKFLNENKTSIKVYFYDSY